MVEQPIWRMERGETPLVAAAIHAGHKVRPELAKFLALSEAARLREEDPFTDRWTTVAGTRITGLHSRFEVDLNRPPEKAVYLKPEDAWGLKVWKRKPPKKLVVQSLLRYNAFYAEIQRLFTEMAERFGQFVVFDLHSYNHRRAGPDEAPADPIENPDVNIGTRTLDRERWAPLVERFMADLRTFDFFGRQLDVRENVKFQGGHFPGWIHQTFPQSACALAIEFKKFFMDEWSGEPDSEQIEAIGLALASTVPGVLEELERL